MMNKVLAASSVGKLVELHLGGSEKVTGLLVSAGEDYSVLKTNRDSVLYIQLTHIQGMVVSTKEISEALPSGQEAWSSADTFSSVLTDLKYQWLTINCEGHVEFEGVLDDSNGDYLTLQLNDAAAHLAIRHVTSIALNPKKPEEENQEPETALTEDSKNVQPADSSGGPRFDHLYYYEKEALNL
ncbi:hypothetical protein ACQ0QQ_02860 [Lysinibacillus sphaericus]